MECKTPEQVLKDCQGTFHAPFQKNFESTLAVGETAAMEEPQPQSKWGISLFSLFTGQQLQMSAWCEPGMLSWVLKDDRS